MSSGDRVWRERGLRQAVLAGDESAWQTWYDESFDALYAYVRWRCANLRDLADEVVQETWLTAVKRIRSFDPQQGCFTGWLRGIAGNVLRNHLRRRSLREHASTNGATAAEPFLCDRERREEAEQVAHALSGLPEHYEAVLRAKYLEGHSVNEIAGAWGETPKAVESLLTRARQAFREAYQREHHER
jgi:RNA polymerase sigma-70 factor (ECF subfamily)